ncbi:MAG: 3-oxoacyl-[acyl-carrier-protein] synthase III C-terminal domain-containing protein [Candidatus Lernaella stagnicola]|nr:3-oxoacyl-[acyl-carrier-protein] synthase III C-terminal domain-containing protein [Candidatus Lernaella stagnicola]
MIKHPLPLKIIGIGRYLPKRVVTNAEIEDMAGLARGTIEKTAAGVVERRWVTDETASEMGAGAAQEALDDAGLTIQDIDLILNASGSAEQAIPDGAPLLQRALGMADSGLPGFTVHATCLSFLVALNVAANYLFTGMYKNILIVTSEIASGGINPKEPESFVLFGDAAAAVVVTRPPEGDPSAMTHYLLRTWGSGAYYTCIMGGGTRHHPNHPDTTREHNYFHMDGWPVYQLARKKGPETLEMMRPGILTDHDDIKVTVPHQASMLAIKTMVRLGLPEERIAVTIDRVGNCIAASIPVTLYEVIREKRVERGDNILLFGTGAGLSIGSSILRY